MAGLGESAALLHRTLNIARVERNVVRPFIPDSGPHGRTELSLPRRDRVVALARGHAIMRVCSHNLDLAKASIQFGSS